MTRTAETVQEQQQESEIEQFNKQLREQINQTKILGEENIGNAIEPNPSLTVCNLNPEKKCLSLVRASNDWRNTYSESNEAPFEQGKIPIFLASATGLEFLNGVDHALISQGEAEKVYSENVETSCFYNWNSWI